MKNAGIRWDDQPLGKMPDTMIASTLGVSPAAVYAARNRRCIAAFRPRASSRIVDWGAFPIGDAFDADVAQMAGVPSSAVFDARKSRGINPHTEHRTCVCGATFIARRRKAKWCSKVCRLSYRFELYRSGSHEMAAIAATKSRLARVIAEAAGIHNQQKEDSHEVQ